MNELPEPYRRDDKEEITEPYDLRAELDRPGRLERIFRAAVLAVAALGTGSVIVEVCNAREPVPIPQPPPRAPLPSSTARDPFAGNEFIICTYESPESPPRTARTAVPEDALRALPPARRALIEQLAEPFGKVVDIEPLHKPLPVPHGPGLPPGPVGMER